MAFGNLTVDFRQLSKIPVRDRAAIARSPQASEIFGNLPPNEIAALFPNYYKKFIPASAGGSAMASGLTGAGMTGGGGTGSGTAMPSGSTAPVRPGYIEEILRNASPDSNVRIPLTRGTIVNVQETGKGYNVVEYADGRVEKRSGARNWRNNNPGNIEYGDFAKRLGAIGSDGRFAIFPTYEMGRQAKQNLLFETKNYKDKNIADAISRYAPPSEPENNTASYIRNVTAAIGVSADTKLSSLTEEQRVLMLDAMERVEGFQEGSIQILREAFREIPTALPGTQPITGTATQGSDAGIIPLTGSEAPSTVIPQTIAFDPKILDQFDPRLKEYYYNTASEAEKRQIGEAVRKLGVPGVQEIMSRHPQMTATAVSDKLYQESTKRFAEASSASNFYDTLRNQYPDKIDVNSEIWNQVDPELAKAKGRIVDADTGLVGRDALLAADSAAKVLRKNNYVPRLGSGGDNHSANHGSGRDANYSIDLSASVVNEDGKLVPVQLGKGVPEKVKNDMATAAYFASVGAEGGHRVGYPDSTAPYSMHIQQDPARQSAYWGYSETAKRMGVGTSKLATLQATDEGRRFLAERETINRLAPEQQAEYFDKITGFTEKKLESQSADIVQTTPAQPLPGAAPQTQQQMPVDTNIIPLNQPATANTAPAMKLGGRQNFEEPNTVKESMSVVSNGKEVAQFNKNEKVNVENGQINVENEFQKKARETRQSNDKNIPVGQYKMRQTVEADKSYAEQAKFAIVPESPSIARQNRMAQFGGYNHFSRGSKNT